MNDLQLALVGLGGVLVAGVYAHGKWQEHRQKKQAAGMLGGTVGDALLDADRPAPPPKADAAPAAGGRREPTLGAALGGTHDPANADSLTSVDRLATYAGEPSLPLLSVESDFIAAFSLLEPVSGTDLEGLAQAGLSGLNKRVTWAGYEESSGRWEAILPEGRYRLLRIGVQLADRNGPLTSGLVDQFRKAIDKVADALTAVPEMPNPRDTIARAMHLDRLCAAVDIQLDVHVAPRHDSFVPDVVREAALGIGFRLESDGLLGYPDAGGQRLFSLQMPAARTADGLPAPAVVLLLEVPCVERGEIAFDRMMAVAQELADVLDGIVVDEQRRPITDRFVAPVRQQIVQIQARMAGQGVPAGSPLALRLFS